MKELKVFWNCLSTKNRDPIIDAEYICHCFSEINISISLECDIGMNCNSEEDEVFFIEYLKKLMSSDKSFGELKVVGDKID